jgi:hypothetical protein
VGAGWPSTVQSGYYSSGGGSSSTQTSETACPAGSYCVGGVRLDCPGGRYGNVTMLTLSSCSGSCSAGYYCPAGSISATAFACGNNTVYCPAGAAAPLNVGVGNYSVGVSASTRDSQSVCAAGSYCSGGVSTSCPSGVYGNTSGLSSAACSGLCLAGYYCPLGTNQPTTLPCGNVSVFCPTGSSTPAWVGVGNMSVGGVDVTRQQAQAVCPAGSYCIAGARLPCDAGRYGDVSQRTTSLCVGACTAGYYCIAGSTSSMSAPCGNSTVFCPVGAGWPSTVQSGYYSSGGGSSSTQTSEGPCLPGSYCVGGVRSSCSAGRYGNVTLLTLSSCSGPCPAGYYCPLATGDPFVRCVSLMSCRAVLARPLFGLVVIVPRLLRCVVVSWQVCGNASVFCPPTSVSPTVVAVGNYTVGSVDPRTRSAQAVCPSAVDNAGVAVYCDGSGVRQSCRPGVYGVSTARGLTTAACSAVCPRGYVCSGGTSELSWTPCGGADRWVSRGCAVMASCARLK